jgi:TP901-1 family phage major tail protein
MSPQSGSLLLLKLQNEQKEFLTIGGMRANKFILNNNLIDASCKTSGKWRAVLDKAGISFATVTGAGVFTDSASERLLQEIAFLNKLQNYQLCFANGDILQGCFLITNYERTGNFGEEDTYAISLESSGELKYLTK